MRKSGKSCSSCQKSPAAYDEVLKEEIMRKAFRIGLIISLLLAGVKIGEASPLIGASANTLPRGKFMVDGLFWYMNFTESDILAKGDWVDLPSGDSYEKTLLLPRFYYGISNFLTIRFTLPIIAQSKNFDGLKQSSEGIGDLVIDPKICLVKGSKSIPKISGFTGIRLPTGDDDASPALGDGSTDFLMGILVTHKIKLFTGHATLGYWLNGKDLSDQTFYNLTIEYPFPQNLGALCELNGSMTGEGLFKRDKHILELCPGLQYSGFKGFKMGAAIKLPVLAKGGYRYHLAPFVKIMYLL